MIKTSDVNAATHGIVTNQLKLGSLVETNYDTINNNPQLYLDETKELNLNFFIMKRYIVIGVPICSVTNTLPACTFISKSSKRVKTHHFK